MLDKLDLQMFTMEPEEIDEMVNKLEYAQEIEGSEAYLGDMEELAYNGSEFQGANIKTGLAAMAASLSKIEDQLRRIADKLEKE